MAAVVAAALQCGDPWIRESAVNASRFLPKVRPDLGGRIWRSLAAMSEDDFARERRRLTYAFQLASAFSEISKLIDRRARDNAQWRSRGRWIAGFFGFWRLGPVWLVLKVLPPKPSVEFEAAQLMMVQGDNLVDLELDKSIGIKGYRKSLSLTQGWRFLSYSIVLVILSTIYILYADDEASDYGHNTRVTELSVVVFFQCLVLFSLLASHHFSKRNYPLTIPNEIGNLTIKKKLYYLSKRDAQFVIVLLFLSLFLPIWSYLSFVFIGTGNYLSLPPILENLLLFGSVIFGAGGVIILLYNYFLAVSKHFKGVRSRNTDIERLEVVKNLDNGSRALVAEYFISFETSE